MRPPDAGDAAAEVWLRFVDRRPLSLLTTAVPGLVRARFEAAGVRTLVLIWDDAAWHASGPVRRWVREHSHRVHRVGGVHIVPCFLPTKSPWLNPIEPYWVHGKRRIAEPARLLTAHELQDRVDAAFDCPRADHLTILQEVA